MSDVEDFAAAVDGRLAEIWSVDLLRSGAGLTDVWNEAATSGWFDLGREEAVGALVGACWALGAGACPLPLAEAHVATSFLPDALGRDVATGVLRLAVVDGTRRVELPAEIDAVLLIGRGEVELRSVRSWTALPGIAAPVWGRVEVEAASWVGAPGVAATDRARSLLRLGLVARAAGAAERLHRLAVEHACNRVQFGRPVGAFGAVQQRTATCEIDIVATRLLVDAAAAAYVRGAPDAELAAELAYAFGRDAVRRVLLGGHHTLAAVGYFTEHIGPWVFRRVHADLGSAAALLPMAGGAIDRLVESGGRLPSFFTDPEVEEFRT